MLGEPKGAGTSGSVMEATTAFSRAAALSPSYTSISATGWFSTVVHSVICRTTPGRLNAAGLLPAAFKPASMCHRMRSDRTSLCVTVDMPLHVTDWVISICHKMASSDASIYQHSRPGEGHLGR